MTTRQYLSCFSALLGSGEARTEPYPEYGEVALEPLTTQSAKNTGGVLSSAQKQAGVAWEVHKA